MAYFEPGSRAMLELEEMVEDVGINNVIYALTVICRTKAQQAADDGLAGTAKVWRQTIDSLLSATESR